MKDLLLGEFAQTEAVLNHGGIRLRNVLMDVAEKHPTWTVENLCSEKNGYDEVAICKNCGKYTLKKLAEILAKHGLFFQEYKSTQHSMSYEDWSVEKLKEGWICLGRYEHTNKKDSVPVLFLWHFPPTMSDLTVLVTTDSLGNPAEVSRVFDPEYSSRLAKRVK